MFLVFLRIHLLVAAIFIASGKTQNTTSSPETSTTQPDLMQTNKTGPSELIAIPLAFGSVSGAVITVAIGSAIVVGYCAYKRKKRRRMTIAENLAPSEVPDNEYSVCQNKVYEKGMSAPAQQPSNYEIPVMTHVITETSLTMKYKEFFKPVLIMASRIKFVGTLGEGAFGRVSKGILTLESENDLLENEEGIEVAIKQLKENPSPDEVEEFISESALMLDFDHPNVLKLLGVCFDAHDFPLIVLPYMANGDLKTFLVNKRGNKEIDVLPKGLKVSQLIHMCMDIAKGMEYLSKQKFVHRDLAARNCMVDSQLMVKVADFGFSRDVYSREYYRLERKTRLPVKWLPPESLLDNLFNERTDVWAFGVTCWEVFSLGRVPYPGVDNADIPDYIGEGKRLKKPPLAPREMYSTMCRCWLKVAEERPTFSNLVQLLYNAHALENKNATDLTGEKGDTVSSRSRSPIDDDEDTCHSSDSAQH